jgi:hypothetical protein
MKKGNEDIHTRFKDHLEKQAETRLELLKKKRNATKPPPLYEAPSPKAEGKKLWNVHIGKNCKKSWTNIWQNR